MDHCIQRHLKQSRLNEDQLKKKVKIWYKSLCKIAAERVRDMNSDISDAQLKLLKEECGSHLNETYCLSTFLDCDFDLKSRAYHNLRKQFFHHQLFLSLEDFVDFYNNIFRRGMN